MARDLIFPKEMARDLIWLADANLILSDPVRLRLRSSNANLVFDTSVQGFYFSSPPCGPHFVSSNAPRQQNKQTKFSLENTTQRGGEFKGRSTRGTTPLALAMWGFNGWWFWGFNGKTCEGKKTHTHTGEREEKKRERKKKAPFDTRPVHNFFFQNVVSLQNYKIFVSVGKNSYNRVGPKKIQSFWSRISWDN